MLASGTAPQSQALVRRVTVHSPCGGGQPSWDGFELTLDGRTRLRELEAAGEAAELWLPVRQGGRGGGGGFSV